MVLTGPAQNILSLFCLACLFRSHLLFFCEAIFIFTNQYSKVIKRSLQVYVLMMAFRNDFYMNTAINLSQ